MKQPSVLARRSLWILYAILILVNGFALASILKKNAEALAQNPKAVVFDATLMIAGLSLLTIGVLLFSFLKKRHGIAVIITLIAGVMLAFNTIALGNHFRLIASGYEDVLHGMTAQKLILRHWSIELIPFLMLFEWLRMYLPQWIDRLTHLPEAVFLPAGAPIPDSTLSASASAPSDEDRLLCPLCHATFRNAVTGDTFSCPYCHNKLRAPGYSWEGKKQKKSVAARNRKAEKKSKR